MLVPAPLALLAPFVPTLGLVAAGLGIVTGVPQVVRLLRTPDASGLSYPSAVLGVLSSSGWLLYGLQLLDPAQLVANVPGLLCALATLVLIARRLGLRLAPAALAAAAWAGVLTAATLLGGPVLVGIAATVVSLVKMLPQVLVVLSRTPLHGLAPGTFALTQLSATLWSVYGAATAQTSVTVCSVISLLLATVVLSRRCPPLVVVRALHEGRWGTPGRLLVAPVAPLVLAA
ncbi:SemiSWEET family transporter [Kineococcus gynurae]|uniref:SemiSWEET family transporter n=1 Tax=Kineococcus gynurae TaxID=452979 RepID=A0ABV5LN43_9ACTN